MCGATGVRSVATIRSTSHACDLTLLRRGTQQMYGLPAPQTTPTQMFGSPQPLYSSAPAGMQGSHQLQHQQTRPSPNYPQFRAPTGAPYVPPRPPQSRAFSSVRACVLIATHSRPMMNGAMTTTTVAQTNQMPSSTLSLDYFMLLQTLGTR
jgi:hypothetical protein